MTGEPLPVTRRAGETLRSGTVNAGEAFRFRASAIADQSTYAGIVRMVEAAQTAKAPFIRMADRFALFLLPTTLALAGAAWWASGDPIRALAVLVAATPCPLILAAPVAFIGGVSRAARAGILMKGGAALESLAQVRTAIFDKTGTLTEGGAQLIATESVPETGTDEALRLLASWSRPLITFSLTQCCSLRASAGYDYPNRRWCGSIAVQESKASSTTTIRAGSRALVLGDDVLPEWAERFVGCHTGQPYPHCISCG